MANKPKISPQLLEALEHFGRLPLPSDTTANTVAFLKVRGANGFTEHWTAEQACQVAHRILSAEDLHMLKLKALCDGLKQYGMEDLYQRIMGEAIEKAVVR